MNMDGTVSRRRFVATLPLLALAGCVGNTDGTDSDDNPEPASGGGNSSNTDGGGSSTDTATPTDDDSNTEGTDTPTNKSKTREEEIESLPEPRPLGPALVELFLADDREAVAEERGLNLSGEAVQVEIRLTDSGTPPEKYLPDEYSHYGNTVIAYVNIDDLVDLATAEDVERVFRRFEPKTDE
jgi:hypothetical protein